MESSDLRFCTQCGSPLGVAPIPLHRPAEGSVDSFPASFTSSGVQWTLRSTRGDRGLYRSSLGEAELSATAVQLAISGASPLVPTKPEAIRSGDLVKAGCSLIFVLPFLVIGLVLFPLVGGSLWGVAGVVVGLVVDALIIWGGWSVYRSRS